MKLELDPPAPPSTKTAVDNNFIMVLNSDLHLGDSVEHIKLNLATKEVTFMAKETPDYNWTGWLVNVPENESVTLFMKDNENENQCVLVMDGIYVFEHECTIAKQQQSPFGVDYLPDLKHKITVQFTSVERLNKDQYSCQYMPRKQGVN